MTSFTAPKCVECGESCGPAKGCDIYGDGSLHVHLPGGVRTYSLCFPCEEACLKIHRPTKPDGTWEWVKDCGSDTCGFCKAVKALRH